MLSIGKLAAGQASYYLDQARGRVDVVDSVGEGLEEYYLEGYEARGEWVGSAARDLGLEGVVEGEALRRVLSGLDPANGSPLRSSSSATRVAGFDVTFSAPKSVSVLFGVGDAEIRSRVRAAHDVATRAALGYLERSAAAVRRGHGGAVVEEASGFVAAAFRHRTSRAGDPQLHTHVLVANLGRGVDGRWSALDGRRLYAHARTASFVYQAVLRAELTRSIGVQWTPVRNGDRARVVGVEPDTGAIVIHSRSRRVRLDRRFLAEPTTAGDPPLTHGYAVTGHVAQGLTVDHALVLADDGIDREWAYVALSRGRRSNRIYLNAEADDARADYAPVTRHTIDPVGRLARQLQSSSAQVLAIDSGRPCADVNDAAAEPRRFGWLTDRPRRFGDARPREADLEREQLEFAYGSRPFATERDFVERVDRLHALQDERASERALRRDRGIKR